MLRAPLWTSANVVVDSTLHGVEKLIRNAYVYACEPKDRQPVLHDLQAEERAICALLVLAQWHLDPAEDPEHLSRGSEGR
jgi:hypothetical protein